MDKDLQALQEVRDLLRAAYAAQERLRTLEQDQVDRIVAAMCEAGEKRAEELARMAVEETQMGRVESKTQKNLFMTRTLHEAIRDMRTVGIIGRNEEGTVYEIAEPVGVVAAIIPTTNPTATAMFKSIICLKSRNACVISPHPRAARCIAEAARTVYDAAVAAGAPEGCIRWMEHPTIEATNHLMTHPHTSLILSTGGPGIVKAAYSSGKPALGVGAGNVPVFVERSADLADAVRCIVSSQTFDYGTVCASEQAIVADTPIRDALLEEFRRQGAYVTGEEETALLRRHVIRGDMMNPAVVGQPAARVAEQAGFRIPPETTVLLAPLEKVGPAEPLSREKLCPVLGFYVADGWRKACERCAEICTFGGLGHSLVVHSKDEGIIMEFALRKPAFRILINTPSSQGGVGLSTALFPSMTLGCGTYGGNITSDNISPRHLLNIKRLAIDKASSFRISREVAAQGIGRAGVLTRPQPAPLVATAARSAGGSFYENLEREIAATLGEAKTTPKSSGGY